MIHFKEVNMKLYDNVKINVDMVPTLELKVCKTKINVPMDESVNSFTKFDLNKSLLHGKIVTHSGQFHADEIMCVALILLIRDTLRFKETGGNIAHSNLYRWNYERIRDTVIRRPNGLDPNNDEDHHHDADHEHEHEGEEHEHEAPFQHVRHYKVTLDNSFNIGESRIKALLAYQQNRRQEYEAPDEVGQDFRLHTVNYDLRYVSPAWNGWTMNAGVNGMWQESQNLGHEFLIPAYHLFDFGLFATAAKDFAERLHISGGLRFDNRHLHSNALEEEGQMRFQQFSRNFNGVTGSIGAIYNITPNFDVRVNAARGFRAPNLSELGSFGIHHGTLRFEQGNHDLKPEGSWQFDLGMDYSSEIFSAKLALFANTISNFIFLEKTGSVIDGNDVFGYHQGDAQLLGFEGTVILHPIHHLHFENTFSYVDARQKNQPEEAKYLPFTPAPRWRSSEIEMDCNLKQDHIHSIHNTETRTPSYTLWNASAGTDIHIRGKKLLSVALTAQNIFNRAYQHHLSRLKEAGIYNMGRNIGVKVAVPITL